MTDLSKLADDLAVRMVSKSLVSLVNNEALDGVGRTNVSTEIVGDDLWCQVEHASISPRTTPLRRLHCTCAHSNLTPAVFPGKQLEFYRV